MADQEAEIQVLWEIILLLLLLQQQAQVVTVVLVALLEVQEVQVEAAVEMIVLHQE
jgi:hypothetical protein